MNTDHSEKEEDPQRRPLTVRVSSKAATQMHAQSKEDERKRMEERIKAEETKLIERRARAEQTLAMRAEKKALYRQAKETERLLSARCTDLEEALKLKGDPKKEIERLEARLKEKEKKLEAAEERAIRTQKKRNQLTIEVSQILGDLGEATMPPDASIIELKSQRLREAWNNSEKAWERLQKAIRKRDRNRALKKRAKDLLG